MIVTSREIKKSIKNWTKEVNINEKFNNKIESLEKWAEMLKLNSGNKFLKLKSQLDQTKKKNIKG